jgi:hypothetical protein
LLTQSCKGCTNLLVFPHSFFKLCALFVCWSLFVIIIKG